jgi:hypothetical protein
MANFSVDVDGSMTSRDQLHQAVYHHGREALVSEDFPEELPVHPIVCLFKVQFE